MFFCSVKFAFKLMKFLWFYDLCIIVSVHQWHTLQTTCSVNVVHNRTCVQLNIAQSVVHNRRVVRFSGTVLFTGGVSIHHGARLFSCTNGPCLIGRAKSTPCRIMQCFIHTIPKSQNYCSWKWRSRIMSP